MIFIRLEQITPTGGVNEPFVFCSKCGQYFFAGVGNFCDRCGHKLIKPKEPIMITIKIDEEMCHEDALNYVRRKIKNGFKKNERI